MLLLPLPPNSMFAAVARSRCCCQSLLLYMRLLLLFARSSTHCCWPIQLCQLWLLLLAGLHLPQLHARQQVLRMCCCTLLLLLLLSASPGHAGVAGPTPPCHGM